MWPRVKFKNHIIKSNFIWKTFGFDGRLDWTIIGSIYVVKLSHQLKILSTHFGRGKIPNIIINLCGI